MRGRARGARGRAVAAWGGFRAALLLLAGALAVLVPGAVAQASTSTLSALSTSLCGDGSIGRLNEAFSPSTTSYTATAIHECALHNYATAGTGVSDLFMTVNFTCSASTCSQVRVINSADGAVSTPALSSGSGSQAVALLVNVATGVGDPATITVEVTSQDGTSRTNYTIGTARPGRSTADRLLSLRIESVAPADAGFPSSGVLYKDPGDGTVGTVGFDPASLNYLVEVDPDYTSFGVNATLQGPFQRLFVNFANEPKDSTFCPLENPPPGVDARCYTTGAAPGMRANKTTIPYSLASFQGSVQTLLVEVQSQAHQPRSGLALFNTAGKTLYTIKVLRRARATDSALLGLAISSAGTNPNVTTPLSIPFLPILTAGATHSASALFRQPQVQFTPTVQATSGRTPAVSLTDHRNRANITLAKTGGSAVRLISTELGAALPLDVGSNTFTLTSVSEDGASTATYTFVITRAAPNTDARLAGMTPDTGWVAPEGTDGSTGRLDTPSALWQPELANHVVRGPHNFTYLSAAVAPSVATIRLKPRCSGVVAGGEVCTMLVDGAYVPPGNFSQAIALPTPAAWPVPSVTNITVTVLPEDRSQPNRTYYVAVLRAAVEPAASFFYPYLQVTSPVTNATLGVTPGLQVVGSSLVVPEELGLEAGAGQLHKVEVNQTKWDLELGGALASIKGDFSAVPRVQANVTLADTAGVLPQVNLSGALPTETNATLIAIYGAGAMSPGICSDGFRCILNLCVPAGAAPFDASGILQTRLYARCSKVVSLATNITTAAAFNLTGTVDGVPVRVGTTTPVFNETVVNTTFTGNATVNSTTTTVSFRVFTPSYFRDPARDAPYTSLVWQVVHSRMQVNSSVLLAPANVTAAGPQTLRVDGRDRFGNPVTGLRRAYATGQLQANICRQQLVGDLDPLRALEGDLSRFIPNGRDAAPNNSDAHVLHVRPGGFQAYFAYIETVPSLLLFNETVVTTRNVSVPVTAAPVNGSATTVVPAATTTPVLAANGTNATAAPATTAAAASTLPPATQIVTQTVTEVVTRNVTFVNRVRVKAWDVRTGGLVTLPELPADNVTLAIDIEENPLTLQPHVLIANTTSVRVLRYDRNAVVGRQWLPAVGGEDGGPDRWGQLYSLSLGCPSGSQDCGATAGRLVYTLDQQLIACVRETMAAHAGKVSCFNRLLSGSSFSALLRDLIDVPGLAAWDVEVDQDGTLHAMYLDGSDDLRWIRGSTINGSVITNATVVARGIKSVVLRKTSAGVVYGLAHAPGTTPLLFTIRQHLTPFAEPPPFRASEASLGIDAASNPLVAAAPELGQPVLAQWRGDSWLVRADSFTSGASRLQVAAKQDGAIYVSGVDPPYNFTSTVKEVTFILPSTAGCPCPGAFDCVPTSANLTALGNGSYTATMNFDRTGPSSVFVLGAEAPAAAMQGGAPLLSFAGDRLGDYPRVVQVVPNAFGVGTTIAQDPALVPRVNATRPQYFIIARDDQGNPLPSGVNITAIGINWDPLPTEEDNNRTHGRFALTQVGPYAGLFSVVWDTYRSGSYDLLVTVGGRNLTGTFRQFVRANEIGDGTRVEYPRVAMAGFRHEIRVFGKDVYGNPIVRDNPGATLDLGIFSNGVRLAPSEISASFIKPEPNSPDALAGVSLATFLGPRNASLTYTIRLTLVNLQHPLNAGKNGTLLLDLNATYAPVSLGPGSPLQAFSLLGIPAYPDPVRSTLEFGATQRAGIVTFSLLPRDAFGNPSYVSEWNVTAVPTFVPQEAYNSDPAYVRSAQPRVAEVLDDKTAHNGPSFWTELAPDPCRGREGQPEQCVYMPALDRIGNYRIELRLNGTLVVAGGERSLTVVTQPPSVLSRLSALPRTAAAGQSVISFLEGVDIFGNRLTTGGEASLLEVTLVNANALDLTFIANLTDGGDGNYFIQFQLPDPGSYIVSVVFKNNRLVEGPRSDVGITTFSSATQLPRRSLEILGELPTLDFSATLTTRQGGPGESAIDAGEPYSIVVAARRTLPVATYANLRAVTTVRFQRPGQPGDTVVQPIDMGLPNPDGRWFATVNHTFKGPHSIEVTVGGQQVPGSPFAVRVDPKAYPRSTLSVALVEEVGPTTLVAGQELVRFIQARDEFGNALVLDTDNDLTAMAILDPERNLVEMEVEEAPTLSGFPESPPPLPGKAMYRARVRLTAVGTYNLEIFLSNRDRGGALGDTDQQLCLPGRAGSLCLSQITVVPAELSPANSVAWGAGTLDHRAGDNVTVQVIPFDRFGNRLGAQVFTDPLAGTNSTIALTVYGPGSCVGEGSGGCPVAVNKTVPWVQGGGGGLSVFETSYNLTLPGNYRVAIEQLTLVPDVIEVRECPAFSCAFVLQTVIREVRDPLQGGPWSIGVGPGRPDAQRSTLAPAGAAVTCGTFASTTFELRDALGNNVLGDAREELEVVVLLPNDASRSYVRGNVTLDYLGDFRYRASFAIMQVGRHTMVVYVGTREIGRTDMSCVPAAPDPASSYVYVGEGLLDVPFGQAGVVYVRARDKYQNDVTDFAAIQNAGLAASFFRPARFSAPPVTQTWLTDHSVVQLSFQSPDAGPAWLVVRMGGVELPNSPLNTRFLPGPPDNAGLASLAAGPGLITARVGEAARIWVPSVDRDGNPLDGETDAGKLSLSLFARCTAGACGSRVSPASSTVPASQRGSQLVTWTPEVEGTYRVQLRRYAEVVVERTIAVTPAAAPVFSPADSWGPVQFLERQAGTTWEVPILPGAVGGASIPATFAGGDLEAEVLEVATGVSTTVRMEGAAGGSAMGSILRSGGALGTGVWALRMRVEKAGEYRVTVRGTDGTLTKLPAGLSWPRPLYVFPGNASVETSVLDAGTPLPSTHTAGTPLTLRVQLKDGLGNAIKVPGRMVEMRLTGLTGTAASRQYNERFSFDPALNLYTVRTLALRASGTWEARVGMALPAAFANETLPRFAPFSNGQGTITVSVAAFDAGNSHFYLPRPSEGDGARVRVPIGPIIVVRDALRNPVSAAALASQCRSYLIPPGLAGDPLAACDAGGDGAKSQVTGCSCQTSACSSVTPTANELVPAAAEAELRAPLDPTCAGTFQVVVAVSGTPIKGSFQDVVVLPGAVPVPSRSELVVSSVSNLEVGAPVVVAVILRDSDGNLVPEGSYPLQGFVDMPDGVRTFLTFVYSAARQQFEAPLTPVSSGTAAQVNVLLGGENVQNSPASVDIRPGSTDVATTFAQGNTENAVVGETSEVVVFPTDRGGRPQPQSSNDTFTVTIAPNGAGVAQVLDTVAVRRIQSGTLVYAARFVVQQIRQGPDGSVIPYSLSIRRDGQHIQGSPFVVFPRPAREVANTTEILFQEDRPGAQWFDQAPIDNRTSFPDLLTITAGQRVSLLLQMRDAFGNAAAFDPFATPALAAMTVRGAPGDAGTSGVLLSTQAQVAPAAVANVGSIALQNGRNGTFSLDVALEVAGDYQLTVTLNGEAVRNGNQAPFRVVAGQLATAAVTLTGAGLLNTTATPAGSVAFAVLHLRDARGNVIRDTTPRPVSVTVEAPPLIDGPLAGLPRTAARNVSVEFVDTSNDTAVAASRGLDGVALRAALCSNAGSICSGYLVTYTPLQAVGGDSHLLASLGGVLLGPAQGKYPIFVQPGVQAANGTLATGAGARLIDRSSTRLANGVPVVLVPADRFGNQVPGEVGLAGIAMSHPNNTYGGFGNATVLNFTSVQVVAPLSARADGAFVFRYRTLGLIGNVSFNASVPDPLGQNATFRNQTFDVRIESTAPAPAPDMTLVVGAGARTTAAGAVSNITLVAFGELPSTDPAWTQACNGTTGSRPPQLCRGMQIFQPPANLITASLPGASALQLIDQGEGRYVVSYSIRVAGQFTLTLSFSTGGSLALNITSVPGTFAAVSATAYEPLTGQPVVPTATNLQTIIGVPIPFIATAQDALGNPVPVSEMPTLELSVRFPNGSTVIQPRRTLRDTYGTEAMLLAVVPDAAGTHVLEIRGQGIQTRSLTASVAAGLPASSRSTIQDGVNFQLRAGETSTIEIELRDSANNALATAALARDRLRELRVAYGAFVRGEQVARANSAAAAILALGSPELLALVRVASNPNDLPVLVGQLVPTIQALQDPTTACAAPGAGCLSVTFSYDATIDRYVGSYSRTAARRLILSLQAFSVPFLPSGARLAGVVDVVSTGQPSSSQLRLFGPGTGRMGLVVASREQSIFVTSYDQFGNRVFEGGTSFAVVIRIVREITIFGQPVSSIVRGNDTLVDGRPEVRDNGDGTYVLTYTPTVEAVLELQVLRSGELIPPSPMGVTAHGAARTEPGPVNIACGRPSTAPGCLLGDTVVAGVLSDLSSVVLGPNGAAYRTEREEVLLLAVVDGGGIVQTRSQPSAGSAGSFSGTIRLTKSGRYTFIVAVRGVIVSITTGTIAPSDPSPAFSSVLLPRDQAPVFTSLEGIDEGTPPVPISVLAVDQFGNRRTAGGLPIFFTLLLDAAQTNAGLVTLQMEDLGTGWYVGTFRLTIAGNYTVAARVGLDGTDFGTGRIQMNPGPPEQAQAAVAGPDGRIGGLGLMTAGRPHTVSLTFRDENQNLRAVAGDVRQPDAPPLNPAIDLRTFADGVLAEVAGAAFEQQVTFAYNKSFFGDAELAACAAAGGPFSSLSECLVRLGQHSLSFVPRAGGRARLDAIGYEAVLPPTAERYSGSSINAAPSNVSSTAAGPGLQVSLGDADAEFFVFVFDQLSAPIEGPLPADFAIRLGFQLLDPASGPSNVNATAWSSSWSGVRNAHRVFYRPLAHPSPYFLRIRLWIEQTTTGQQFPLGPAQGYVVSIAPDSAEASATQSVLLNRVGQEVPPGSGVIEAEVGGAAQIALIVRDAARVPIKTAVPNTWLDVTVFPEVTDLTISRISTSRFAISFTAAGNRARNHTVLVKGNGVPIGDLLYDTPGMITVQFRPSTLASGALSRLTVAAAPSTAGLYGTDAEPARSEGFGPLLARPVAGAPMALDMDVRDIFGDIPRFTPLDEVPVEAAMTLKQDDVTRTPCFSLRRKDEPRARGYWATCRPTIAGAHNLRVALYPAATDELVGGVSQSVFVEPGPLSLQATRLVPDIRIQGSITVSAARLAFLPVLPRDRFGNLRGGFADSDELTLRLWRAIPAGPGSPPVLVDDSPIYDSVVEVLPGGQFAATLVAFEVGTWRAELLEPATGIVVGRPFTLTVTPGPVVAAAANVAGPGLTGSVAEQDALVRVTLNDGLGNPTKGLPTAPLFRVLLSGSPDAVTGASDPGFNFTVNTGAQALADGVFEVTYSVQMPGAYSLLLIVDGQVAGGNATGFPITVSPRTSPVVQSSRLSDDLAAIAVSFAEDTDFGRPAGSGTLSSDCAFFLAPSITALLGTGPTCVWSSPRVLVIRLGSNATVLPTTSDPTHRVAFRTGVVRSAKKNSFAVQGSVAIASPESPVRPRLSVNAPSTLGLCDDLVIDASRSTGGGGRGLAYTFAITAQDANDQVAVSSALQAAEQAARTTGVLRLPGNIFVPGKSYTGLVLARTFVGSETSQILPFTKGAAPTPRVGLLVRSPLSVERSRSVVVPLSVASARADCANGTAASVSPVVVLQWAQTAGPALSRASFPSATAFATYNASLSSRTLNIPPRALAPGTRYAFRATAVPAGTTSSQFAATAEVTVDVVSTPLRAAFRGGSRLVPASKSQFDLTVAPFDPDNALDNAGNPTPYQYVWTCRVRGGGVCAGRDGVSLANLLSTLASSPTLTLTGGSRLPVGLYDLSVQVSREPLVTGRTVTATAEVEVAEVDAAYEVVILAPSVARVNPSEALVLETSKLPLLSPAGNPSQATVRWELRSGVLAGGRQLAEVSNANATDNERLTVRPDALVEGQTYVVRLVGTGIAAGTYSEYSFTVNERPWGGSLSLSITAGGSDPYLATEGASVHRVSLDGWTDVAGDVPLSYSIAFVPNADQLGVAAAGLDADALDWLTLGPREQPLTPEGPEGAVDVMLPAGSHLLVGRVIDQHGAFRRVVAPRLVVVQRVAGDVLVVARRAALEAPPRAAHVHRRWMSDVHAGGAREVRPPGGRALAAVLGDTADLSARAQGAVTSVLEPAMAVADYTLALQFAQVYGPKYGAPTSVGAQVLQCTSGTVTLAAPHASVLAALSTISTATQVTATSAQMTACALAALTQFPQALSSAGMSAARTVAAVLANALPTLALPTVAEECVARTVNNLFAAATSGCHTAGATDLQVAATATDLARALEFSAGASMRVGDAAKVYILQHYATRVERVAPGAVSLSATPAAAGTLSATGSLAAPASAVGGPGTVTELITAVSTLSGVRGPQAAVLGGTDATLTERSGSLLASSVLLQPPPAAANSPLALLPAVHAAPSPTAEGLVLTLDLSAQSGVNLTALRQTSVVSLQITAPDGSWTPVSALTNVTFGERSAGGNFSALPYEQVTFSGVTPASGTAAASLVQLGIISTGSIVAPNATQSPPPAATTPPPPLADPGDPNRIWVFILAACLGGALVIAVTGLTALAVIARQRRNRKNLQVEPAEDGTLVVSAKDPSKTAAGASRPGTQAGSLALAKSGANQVVPMQHPGVPSPTQQLLRGRSAAAQDLPAILPSNPAKAPSRRASSTKSAFGLLGPPPAPKKQSSGNVGEPTSPPSGSTDKARDSKDSSGAATERDAPRPLALEAPAESQPPARDAAPAPAPAPSRATAPPRARSEREAAPKSSSPARHQEGVPPAREARQPQSETTPSEENSSVSESDPMWLL